MKIVFLDASTVGDIKTTSRLKEFGDLVLFDATTSDQTLERVKNAEIILTNKVIIDKPIIDASPLLKLICVTATGINNVDHVYAKSKGIRVQNVSNYSTDSVVQVTFGFIFHFLNHTPFYNDFVWSGQYSQSPVFTNISREIRQLAGKEFGIIGLGTIGKKVAEIATAFGANVSYFSSSGQDRDHRFPRKNLENLLRDSDIVSIHAPLNEKTYGLIGGAELKLMKSTSYIFNMGRGGIIKEADLAGAIDSNIIAGAGVDVFDKEPININNPLLKVKNKDKLILTPHIAWSGKEARETLMEKTYENIKNFLNK